VGGPVKRALSLLLLCCCGPKSGQVRSEAIVVGALSEVVLSGVRSLDTLEGDRVSFSAGAKLTLSFATDGGCTLDGISCDAEVPALRQAVIGASALPVRPRFAFTGGVQRPLDYDTLNLTTLYYLISAAQDFYGAYAVDPTPTAGPVPVYYGPDPTSLTQAGVGTTDNAAYFQLVDGFLILPMVNLQALPFSMSRGVIFHEYFHRVFALRVYGAQALRAFVSADRAGLTAIMRLRAVNEGLADFFGALGAGDPGYVGLSVAQDVAAARNPSLPRKMQAEWLDAAQPTIGGVYDPYPPGECFANLMWRARDAVGEEATIRAWFTADQTLAAAVTGHLADVTFGFVVDAIVNGFPASDRPPVCAAARDIFAVIAADLTACPP
jgi:hypothetical protein